MAQNYKKIRLIKFHEQHGRCYYCGCIMWEWQCSGQVRKGPEALWYQCTAEHLTARSDGGGNEADNIAAACLRCNRERHLMRPVLEPAKYRAYVQTRMEKGEWHQPGPH